MPWPDAEAYGKRFAEIDAKLDRSFANAELRWTDPDTAGRIRYRLAKLAIAGEDIRRAIAVLEQTESQDTDKAEALVELRNACGEVTDSFDDIDDVLLELLNRTSQ